MTVPNNVRARIYREQVGGEWFWIASIEGAKLLAFTQERTIEAAQREMERVMDNLWSHAGTEGPKSIWFTYDVGGWTTSGDVD
jgi:hypothetical protein